MNNSLKKDGVRWQERRGAWGDDARPRLGRALDARLWPEEHTEVGEQEGGTPHTVLQEAACVSGSGEGGLFRLGCC